MSNKPTHIAHVVTEVREGGVKRSYWRRVGSVFPHSKGNGFDLVVYDQVAVMGRIVCTEPKERPEETTEAVA